MSDISKIDNGTEYNLKDATARAGIESSKTLKSSVVTVNDAAPINAEDITVDIEPQQDLHGYDRPWAGGAGKNKSSINDCNTGASSDIYTQPILIGSERVYTISMKLKRIDGVAISNPNLYVFRLEEYDNTDTLINTINSNIQYLPSDLEFSFNQTVTLNANTAYVIAKYNNFNGDSNVNTHKFNIQIEQGSTPTSYAPYSNICPIEGRTGAELDRDGANRYPILIGDDAFNNNASGTHSKGANGELIVSCASSSNASGAYANANSTFREVLKALAPCYVSFDIKGSANATVEVGKAGVSTVDVTTQTQRVSVKYNAGEYTFVAYGKGNAITLTISNFMVSIEPTAYEPYQGEQYTANFGETVHGGKWHVTKGGTTVDKGYLTENSIKGVSGGTSAGGLHWYDMPLYSIYNANALISNMLVEMSGDDAWRSSNACMSVNSNGKIRLYFKSSTIADAKTELNGLQIVYELVTPTTISTPKQDVPMLQGINTVSADCGDVSLKYQPDNVIGELKGEIQKANSFVERMALREGSGAKDFSYGGWSFRLYIYRSMGQISMSLERISASSVIEQAVIKTFMGESDYRAPEYLRPIFSLNQAATYTTPSGWALQVHLTDEGYIMFEGMAPEVGASAPISSNWNLVEPWATHQQAKDLFNN